MKKIFYSLLLFILFSPAGIAAAESINVFDVEITPNTDGSFQVTEKIVYDFGELSRHGIFRHLDKTHHQPASVWYKKRHIDIDLMEVLADNKTAQYEISDSVDRLTIKIGDPNVEISGVHLYTITYRVDGGLSYYPDENVTELYWNVTGHEWMVPIKRAIARVSTAGDLLEEERSCFAGWIGETNTCDGIVATSTHMVFVSPYLPPGSGFTIAQSLDHKAVAKVVVEDSLTWIFWVLGGFAWLVLAIWFVYRYKTKYNPHTTVVSQYEPFEDFKPMFTGVLQDGRLDARDITAGLVYLAEQGFIKIRKTNEKVLLIFDVDDYEVTLLKDPDLVETDFLREVLLLLFNSYDSVGETIKLSKLKSNSGKRSANAKAVKKLKNAVLDDLERRGYFERFLDTSTLTVVVMLGAIAVPFVFPLLIGFAGTTVFPVAVIAIATLVVLGFAYQRRTRKGYEALNHLKGFKDFLSVTDKERFKFHNAPDKNPEQFMRFLPYAIALGVEKEWSEVFSEIQIPNPEWYEGSNIGTTFSAAALSNDLGAFATSFTQSTSSQSSASSGGGGFSGGGAGGGGGGSW